MSLFTVPCALVATAAFQVAFTSPNPPPERKKQVKGAISEVVLPVWVRVLVLKAICWAATIAESVAIIAGKMSPSPISHYICTKLFHHGGPENLHFTSLFAFGAVSMVAGGLIRWQCYRVMGKLFTFEMAIHQDHKLVTSGPYAVVRHPSYIATFCIFMGLFCWHATPGSWVQESGVLRTSLGMTLALTFLVISSFVVGDMLLRMSKEDEVMKKEFGRIWVEWAQRVPSKLIPGIY